MSHHIDLADSSGVLSASGVVSTRCGTLCGVLLVAGSAAATVSVYDNATAGSGTVLLTATIPANTSQMLSLGSTGINSHNGLYASISGTGSSCIVYSTKS